MKKNNHYMQYFLFSLLAHCLLIIYIILNYWPKHNRNTINLLQAYVPTEFENPTNTKHEKQTTKLALPIHAQNKINIMHAVQESPITQKILPITPKQSVPETITHNRIEAKRMIIKILHQAISATQHYPEIAAELNQQGTVTVKFLLFPDGHLSDIAILKSSGFTVLDEAALLAVRSISPAKNAGSYLQKSEFFSVDVVFE